MTLETLVCHDSRVNGAFDLADKELLYLLHQVTRAGNVHLVVILDCCHSGGLTKVNQSRIRIRSMDVHPVRRRADQFYGYQKGTGYPSTPGYVLLAACQPLEDAFDGNFTPLMLPLLKDDPYISYQSLMSSVIRNNEMAQQHPLISPEQHDWIGKPFLNRLLQKV